MAATIWIKGEGGIVMEHDTPLSEPLQQRLRDGRIKRCNPDGSTWHGEDTEDAEGERPDLPPPPNERPAHRAPRADWAAWAVAQGADPEQVENMTKGDLIERFGRD